MIFRAWIIVQDGKPVMETLRQSRPAAWDAWQNHARPQDGFHYNARAVRVRVKLEEAG